ncbi:uncharacterized protein LOC143471283 isoform X1 [Clavelina lepadiformis]|uniref:uncharacterized protein LOC143471283 isoform X1 n=1 Tax=Clavelina lepadiformis TaxID=159417 RepID=UPI0040413118
MWEVFGKHSEKHRKRKSECVEDSSNLALPDSTQNKSSNISIISQYPATDIQHKRPSSSGQTLTNSGYSVIQQKDSTGLQTFQTDCAVVGSINTAVSSLEYQSSQTKRARFGGTNNEIFGNQSQALEAQHLSKSLLPPNVTPVVQENVYVSYVQNPAESTNKQQPSRCETPPINRKFSLEISGRKHICEDQVYQLLNDLKFPISKLIACSPVDNVCEIVCKSRCDVLELFELLNNCRSGDLYECVELYEKEEVQVKVWPVSVFLDHSHIQSYLEQNHGKVLSISYVRNRYGLLSNARMTSMNRRDLDQKPIPNQIFVGGKKLFVTYEGQMPQEPRNDNNIVSSELNGNKPVIDLTSDSESGQSTKFYGNDQTPQVELTNSLQVFSAAANTDGLSECHEKGAVHNVPPIVMNSFSAPVVQNPPDICGHGGNGHIQNNFEENHGSNFESSPVKNGNRLLSENHLAVRKNVNSKLVSAKTCNSEREVSSTQDVQAQQKKLTPQSGIDIFSNIDLLLSVAESVEESDQASSSKVEGLDQILGIQPNNSLSVSSSLAAANSTLQDDQNVCTQTRSSDVGDNLPTSVAQNPTIRAGGSMQSSFSQNSANSALFSQPSSTYVGASMNCPVTPLPSSQHWVMNTSMSTQQPLPADNSLQYPVHMQYLSNVQAPTHSMPAPTGNLQHTEIIISKLKTYQYKSLFSWRDDEKRELLRVYEQIHQISDEQLTTNAAKLFPEELNLFLIELTESQIDSLLFILTKVEKRIKWLLLMECFYKPEDVGRLFEAIQAMPGKIERLYIGGNIIPKIPSKSFFNKIEDGLNMRNCFPDGDATDGKRDANQSEIDEIQRVLDQLDDSVLFMSCYVCVKLNIAEEFNLKLLIYRSWKFILVCAMVNGSDSARERIVTSSCDVVIFKQEIGFTSINTVIEIDSFTQK